MGWGNGELKMVDVGWWMRCMWWGNGKRCLKWGG